MSTTWCCDFPFSQIARDSRKRRRFKRLSCSRRLQTPGVFLFCAVQGKAMIIIMLVGLCHYLRAAVFRTPVQECGIRSERIVHLPGAEELFVIVSSACFLQLCGLLEILRLQPYLHSVSGILFQNMEAHSQERWRKSPTCLPSVG